MRQQLFDAYAPGPAPPLAGRPLENGVIGRATADLGQRAHFAQIDVLRAYAALTVVFFHVGALFKWTTFPALGPLAFFNIGGIGVDLFFVISGFVISLSAFSLIDRNQAGFRYTFLVKRFSRIAPLYYLTCAAFVIFIYPHYFFDGSLLNDGLLHVLFVHNLSERYAGAIDGVNWSIGVEMQFYLLVIILGPQLRTTRPWFIAVAVLVVALAWRYYFMLTTNIGGQGVYHRFWVITQLPGVIDEFTMGILLARFIRSDLGRSVLATCESRPWIVVVITIVISWPALIFVHAFLETSWTSTGMCVLGRPLLALMWAWLVFAACSLSGPIASLITAPARYLGTISYGIYLWHLPVIMTLHLRLQWLDGPRAWPLVLGLTCTLAAASWHFFERPFMDRAKLRL